MIVRRVLTLLRRPRVLVIVGVVVALCAATTGTAVVTHASSVANRPVRLVVAGDMACDPDDPDFLAHSDAEGDHCRQDDVSTIAVRLNPDLLLGLGDYQYEVPTTAAYRDVYGPSWGRLRASTIPVFGNQEYKVRDAYPFTTYFGNRIGDKRGYWSQEVGPWHLVVLNSNCTTVVGGCAKDSPQQRWLAADLAGTDRKCVLAAWHHPRWSTGIAGPNDRTADLFKTLYDHQVELVFSGHEADYERFGPLDPDGKPDPRGVRQIVVGTGGQAHYAPTADDRGPLPDTAPKSTFVDYQHHGLVDLTLNPDGWTLRFRALDSTSDARTGVLADQETGHCF